MLLTNLPISLDWSGVRRDWNFNLSYENELFFFFVQLLVENEGEFREFFALKECDKSFQLLDAITCGWQIE